VRLLLVLLLQSLEQAVVLSFEQGLLILELPLLLGDVVVVLVLVPLQLVLQLLGLALKVLVSELVVLLHLLLNSMHGCEFLSFFLHSVFKLSYLELELRDEVVLGGDGFSVVALIL
jgi:hypothetical protein